MTHRYTKFQFKMSICNGDNERKLKINGIFLSPRGTTLPKIIRPDPNSNSTCLFSWHIYIPNFNSKCQFIRYARACSSYECFVLRAMRLSNKLLGQGYVKERLKSSLRKLYGRYGDLTKQYEVPLSRMLHDILDDDHIQWHPPLIGHYTNFWPLLI